MEKRRLGKTDLEVMPLGLGTAELGYIADFSQEDCDRLLNIALDEGVNFIDTAVCYGDSEEKIGKAISSRRGDYILLTKCGHDRENTKRGHKIDGLNSDKWSPNIVAESLERSLKTLKSDYVDILLLHSGPMEMLENDDVIEAMCKCRDSGKAHFIGYSGDNEEAIKAISLSVFDVLETSVNICDQRAIDDYLPQAKQADFAVVAKKPLAHTCWRSPSDHNRFSADRAGLYHAQLYADRLKKMNFTPQTLSFDGDWLELALRFTAWQEGLSVCLTGSTNPDHIRQNIKVLQKGPLDEETVGMIRQLWTQNNDGSWDGQT